MRRELALAVRQEFSAQLAKELPQFRPLKGQKIGSRCYPYSWQVSPDLTFFVMLQVSTKALEEFTLEVAFSSDGRYPIEMFSLLPFNFANVGVPALASHPSWRLNLAHLWRQGEKYMDYWWEITPHPSHRELAQRLKDLVSRGSMDEMPLDEALQRVGPAVSDAIRRLIENGLPFLREVASCRGIKLLTD